MVAQMAKRDHWRGKKRCIQERLPRNCVNTTDLQKWLKDTIKGGDRSGFGTCKEKVFTAQWSERRVGAACSARSGCLLRNVTRRHRKAGWGLIRCALPRRKRPPEGGQHRILLYACFSTSEMVYIILTALAVIPFPFILWATARTGSSQGLLLLWIASLVFFCHLVVKSSYCHFCGGATQSGSERVSVMEPEWVKNKAIVTAKINHSYSVFILSSLDLRLNDWTLIKTAS